MVALPGSRGQLEHLGQLVLTLLVLASCYQVYGSGDCAGLMPVAVMAAVCVAAVDVLGGV